MSTLEKSTVHDHVLTAQSVFITEINELKKVSEKINEDFSEVVELIYNSTGKTIITGIGKSGIIGKKIASSLASTGSHSFFMNSAEGLHGDLGMINQNDLVIAISNSGTSQEVIDLIPSIKKIGCKLVALTGNPKSILGENSDYILNVGVEEEACPLNLAPTSSTTATLVMGDALTVALINKRGFKAENFAVYHPGGALGKRLLTKVSDLAHKDIPKVDSKSSINDVIYQISSKRLGMTLVYNEKKLVGIITDGDIRRTLAKQNEDVYQITASEIMNKNYKSIDENEMANIALETMDQNKITCLIVKNSDLNVTGIITLHDLFGF